MEEGGIVQIRMGELPTSHSGGCGGESDAGAGEEGSGPGEPACEIAREVCVAFWCL